MSLPPAKLPFLSTDLDRATRVVNLRNSPYDIYIGRGSKWGNPYGTRPSRYVRHVVDSREMAIVCYRHWILGRPDLLAALSELHGKTLGCFCKPLACHGDVLVSLAEELGQ